jgi:hypothetical protein
MSVYLLASSLVTTILIPAAEFADGGQAKGSALAWLISRVTGAVSPSSPGTHDTLISVGGR